MTATRMSAVVCVGTALTLVGLFVGCNRGKSYASSIDSGQPKTSRCACCSGGTCLTRGKSTDSASASATGPETSPAKKQSKANGENMTDIPIKHADPSGEEGKYGGQTTCPVTDEELGSMGPPVPVKVKGQTIYVCCKGCVKTVESSPEQYIAKVARERGVK